MSFLAGVFVGALIVIAAMGLVLWGYVDGFDVP